LTLSKVSSITACVIIVRVLTVQIRVESFSEKSDFTQPYPLFFTVRIRRWVSSLMKAHTISDRILLSAIFILWYFCNVS
jgi:hypothetical protein